jgi:hypothetical protein
MLRTLALLALLVLAGCFGPRALEREVTGQPLVTACLESYRLIDLAIVGASVRDVEAHRVPGFPYLRVDRFLASFSHQDLSPARLEAWVARLIRLDREGRTVELKNLPDGSRARLDDAIAAVLGAGWRAQTWSSGARRYCANTISGEPIARRRCSHASRCRKTIR